jgi:hypothetical protein
MKTPNLPRRDFFWFALTAGLVCDVSPAECRATTEAPTRDQSTIARRPGRDVRTR